MTVKLGQQIIASTAAAEGMTEELAEDVASGSPSDCRANIVKEEKFLCDQFRWNTSEEIYIVLNAVEQHCHWLSGVVVQRPSNGSMLLYNRQLVNYRNDGYLWKKRRDGKQIREDHMKLKIKGEECIYGCYAHSALVPSFHRRCYWLLHNPDVILVHYLNMPGGSEDKGLVTLPYLQQLENRGHCALTSDEMLAQLEPMYRLPNGQCRLTQSESMVGDRLKSSISVPRNGRSSIGHDNKLPLISTTSQWVLNLGCHSSGNAVLIVNSASPAPTTIATSATPSAVSTQSSEKPLVYEVSSLAANHLQNGTTITENDKGHCSSIDNLFITSQAKNNVHFSESTNSGNAASLITGSDVTSMLDLSTDELSSIFSNKMTDVLGTTIHDQDDTCIDSEHIIDDFDLFDWSTSKYSSETELAEQKTENAFVNSSVSIEFAPSWSTTSGGDKMLLVGPWSAVASALPPRFVCRFGSVGVSSAELISERILRCIVPASIESGQVRLLVECDDQPLVDVGMFEYRTGSCCQEHKSMLTWFSIKDAKVALAERVIALDQWLLATKRTTMPAASECIVQFARYVASDTEMETKVTDIATQWKSLYNSKLLVSLDNDCGLPLPGGLKLLHLAAALGYSKVIEALLDWSRTFGMMLSDASVLEPDDHGCTAMHWACALGKQDAAATLFAGATLQGADCLHTANCDGLLPLAVARLAGHSALALHLSNLNKLTGTFQSSAVDSKLSTTQACSTINPRYQSCNQPAEVDSGVTLLRTSAASFNRSLDCPMGASRKTATSRRVYTTLRNAQRMKRQSSLSVSQDAMESCLRPVSSDPVIASSMLVSIADQSHRLSLTGKNFGELISIARSEAEQGSYIDVETVSDEETRGLNKLAHTDAIAGPNSSIKGCRMRSLAKQIIAAMPERIKTARAMTSSICLSEKLPSTCTGFGTYRCQASIRSQSSVTAPILEPFDDLRPNSPPTTTEDFSEYFNANAANMEKYFSCLTLSDQEQQKLYEAAKVIQNAYRLFKDKKQQQQREIEAATVIQAYYRRYKKYKYQLSLQRMQQAAVRIQSQFRSYYAQKRFRQSRAAALIIQHQYRAYKESNRMKQSSRSGSISGAIGGIGNHGQHKFRTPYCRQLATETERCSTAVGVSSEECKQKVTSYVDVHKV